MADISVEEGGFLGGVLAARVHHRPGTMSDADADDQRRARRDLAEQISARFHGQLRHTSDGGLLAVFDSVNAAATAAVTLQRQFPIALGQLSCVVGGGEISTVRGGFSGLPVESVLDLIDESQPGQVLLSSAARFLAGSRLTFPVNETSSATQHIQWRPLKSLATELDLPAALAVHDQQPFVGRQPQRAELRRLLGRAQEGATLMCSVVAGAGLGKTRLLSELAVYARDQGIVVVGGAADEDLTRPFAPVAQGLEHMVDHASDLATRLGPGVADLVRILPRIGERLVDLPRPIKGDSHTERQALFSAVAGWLSALAAEETLLVMLDSLHWEGDSTFELLIHLLGRVGGRPMLIVTSHRTDDPRTARLLSAARLSLGENAVTEMPLAGLDEAEIREFLSGGAAADDPPGADLIQSVLDITSGSPLHLTEVKRNPSQAGVRSARVNLNEVIKARFNALEQPLRRVIEVASVVGEVFELKDVAAICDKNDDPIGALDGAQEEGLVTLIDPLRLSYRFAHSLTRDVVYGGLGAARRAQLHHRAGVAIEAQGLTDQRVNDLARHYAQAAPLGFESSAIDYSLRAGNQALNQFANEMALGHFEQGLAFLLASSNGPVEIDLLTGVGRAQRRLGIPNYRDALFSAADKALKLNDGERMAVAVYSAYRGSYTRALHVDDDAVTHLRQALTLLGDDHPGHRARLLALLAIELTWSEDRSAAGHASDQAIEVASQFAPELLLQVLTHALWVQFHPMTRRLNLAKQVRRLVQPETDPRLLFEIASHEIFTASRVGDRHRLDQAHSQARTLAQRVDQPGERSMLLLRDSTLALMEGRFPDVLSAMTERRQLAKSIGEADGEAAYRIHQYWFAYDQAEPQQMAQLVAMAGARLDPRQRFFAWPTLLMPACDTENREMAMEIVAALAKDGFDTMPQDQMWLWNVAQLSYAVNRLGLVDHAQALLQLLSIKRNFQANMVFNTLGSAARYAGLLKALLGDQAGAREDISQALSDNQQFGAVTWAARCQLDLAALDIAQGQWPAALLDEVDNTARRLKMPLLLAQLAKVRSSSPQG